LKRSLNCARRTVKEIILLITVHHRVLDEKNLRTLKNIYSSEESRILYKH